MTIAEVADRIGEHICERGNIKEKFGVVAYGIEIALGLIITCTTIIICGAVVGLPKETSLVLGGALFMKYIIGGPHLSGFMRCVWLSAFLVLIFTWLSGFPIFSEFLVTAGLGTLGFLGILLWAPLMNFEDEMSRRYQCRLRKFLAMAVFGGILLLHLLSGNMVYTLIFSGFMLSIVNVSPMGILLTDMIEKITNKGGEKI